MDEVESRGIVVQGHRVASGAAGDARFPHGTILPQLPFFRRAIPDFDRHLGGPPFAGTVNVALARPIAAGEPEVRVADVRWTDHFPPETFFLWRGALLHGGVRYPAFLYRPDPATKPDHPQDGRIVEMLARRVPGLAYGDAVAILHAPGAIGFVASR